MNSTSHLSSTRLLLPIGTMFALFFMIAFVTGLPNPIGVIVAKQFNASIFETQLGTFANFIAYAFMGIPAGLMIKKIGYKKTALTAVTVGFVGLGFQYLSGQMGSFEVYLVGAFIAGFSMCMLNAVVNPMLNTLGGGGNRGNQLIQFGGSMNSLGATIVPVLVGYLMGPAAGRTLEKANPALFIAMGIFAIAFIVLAMVKIPEPHMTSEEQSSLKGNRHSPLSFLHFVLGIIAIFMYVGIEVGIPNMVNQYMTHGTEYGGLNMDATDAGTLVGTYWFLMLVGRLLGASLGAKFSSKIMLTAVSLLGIALVLSAIMCPVDMRVNMVVFQSSLSFGIVEVPINVVLLVLCGLCTSVMWGGIFNLAVEGLGKYTPAAAGIFMVMVCGGGILPLIQSHIADLTNYLASFWVIFFALAYILHYALFGHRNVNKEILV